MELELKLYLEAAKHLEFCLRHFPSGESTALKKEIKANFNKVRNHVSPIWVKVKVPGAKIFVDDELVGTSPIDHPLFVAGGEHTVRAEAENGTDEETFSVEKGATRTISLAIGESILPESGLDNEAPVTKGEPAPVLVERNWTPAWILGGVSVAGLGSWAVFSALKGGKANAVEDAQSELTPGDCGAAAAPTACGKLSDAMDQHDTYATTSNVSLIIAGVGAAATLGYVTYVLLDEPNQGSVNASFGTSPDGGFFSLSGSF